MDALVTIPDRLITEYKSIVDLNNDDATITCIEKVEALERFGIVLIYKVVIIIKHTHSCNNNINYYQGLL